MTPTNRKKYVRNSPPPYCSGGRQSVLLVELKQEAAGKKARCTSTVACVYGGAVKVDHVLSKVVMMGLLSPNVSGEIPFVFCNIKVKLVGNSVHFFCNVNVLCLLQ